jgi:hypothetical protein
MAKAPSRADLEAYLDDALSEADLARVEQALRESPSLRQILQRIMQERDRGEHSLGAIWRRHRLTCFSREEMSHLLMGIMDEAQSGYFHFHLDVIQCPYCHANWADLQRRRQEPAPVAQQRRDKLFTSSVGTLRRQS